MPQSGIGHCLARLSQRWEACSVPTYYVDATSGDNTKDGLSEANAWQTIAKVVGSAFVAGDSILFKRGETWTGTALTVTWSGALGNPITFGAYGSGAKPVIDGNDAVNCVWCSGRSHLVFQDIETTQGFDAGFSFTTCHHIQVIDCDAHDCGNDNLIFITTCYDCSVTGGRFYNAYPRVVGVNVSGIEIADDCHDITLTNVTCYDNTGTVEPSGLGITIHNHAATVMPYNIAVTGAACYGNMDYGINIWNQNNTPHSDRNIVIRDCVCYGNDEGIRVHKSAVATAYPNGVTLDNCHSRDNTTRAYYLQGDNLNVRRSAFDGVGYVTSCVGLRFYNNTLYLPTGGGDYPLYITNARTADNEVQNCIVYCATSGGMAIGVDATVTAAEVDIDYNLYYLAAEAITAARWYWRGTAYGYADWLTNSTQDANSPAPAEPQFVSVPADNFQLQAGSPAIGAGTDLGLFYSGAAPDLGAYERWTRRGVTWLHLAGAHEEDD